MPNDPKVDRHILQWNDLSTPQRKVVSDNIRTTGENMPQRVSHQLEKTKTSKNKKADVQGASLAAIQPHVVSRPVTLQKAANNRQRLYEDALVRQQGSASSPHNVTPEGGDWYFEHNARIAHSADQTGGFPHEWAHAASAVMSPQNSPENERASVHHIMDALANHKVEVTPEVTQHLAKHGIDVSEHTGQIKHFDELPTGSLAHLSASDFRDKVPTTANLREVARGGTKENITKAEMVLTGQTTPDDAVVNKNGAITGSKVASYSHVIRSATPGSSTHVEFAGRVHQDAAVRAGHISPDQQALDLYGHGEVPKDHLLSPHSHTVEDTWQNAVTMDQPKTLTGTGDKTSVFKAAGSGEQYPIRGLKTRRNEEGKQVESAHPDARVSDAMLQHAYNNRATQKAAEQQGVPPVAMQGVAWTEARRQAGKSREGTGSPEQMSNEDYKTEVDIHHRMGRSVPAHAKELQERHRPDDNAGQGVLFGAKTPAGRTRDFDTSDVPDDPEADMRKWAAIGKNTRKGRLARQTGIKDLTK